MLNQQLEKLEEGDWLSCLDRLSVPLGRNMEGVTTSMENLSTMPDFGFSNPGGSWNLGATTSGVSLDQFA